MADEEGNGILVDININFLLQRTSLTFAQEKCHTKLLEDQRCILNLVDLSQELQKCFQSADALPQDLSNLFTIDKLFKSPPSFRLNNIHHMF